ncbi:MAG: type II toxin-antitoxin system prevent-host-death family antitoxin [Deltaproteobacteria bacterium]|nr:type II toxin-antitoxin system prevent-host-death family antitoxin [Deltaproteobacteria bacterium]
MKAVSVTQLKAELSKYLKAVRRGTEVQILERGVPIARLVGMPAPGTDSERVERLVRSGILRPGRGDARPLLVRPPIAAPGADVSGALADDREDRV